MLTENNELVEDLPSNTPQQDIHVPSPSVQQDPLSSAIIGSEEWYTLLKDEPQFIFGDVSLLDTYPFNPVCNEINQLMTTFQGQGVFKLYGKEEKQEYPADYVLRKLLGSVLRVPNSWKEEINEYFATKYFTDMSYIEELYPHLLSAGLELIKYPQIPKYLQIEINIFSLKDFLRVSSHGEEIPTYARFITNRRKLDQKISDAETALLASRIAYSTTQNIASNLDSSRHKGGY